MTDGEEAGRGHGGLGPSSSTSLVIPCHIGYGPQQRDLVNFDCITSTKINAHYWAKPSIQLHHNDTFQLWGSEDNN